MIRHIRWWVIEKAKRWPEATSYVDTEFETQGGDVMHEAYAALVKQMGYASREQFERVYDVGYWWWSHDDYSPTAGGSANDGDR